MDRLTPRQRLSHKLRDGKYRALRRRCHADTIPVAAALFFLSIHHCYYCNEPLPDGELWTLEHKIPLANGGAHILSNLCKSCSDCNTAKHLLTDDEFLELINLLKGVA